MDDLDRAQMYDGGGNGPAWIGYVLATFFVVMIVLAIAGRI